MRDQRFARIHARSVFIALGFIFLAAGPSGAVRAPSGAAGVPAGGSGRARLEGDTLDLLLRLDASLAPACEERTLVSAEEVAADEASGARYERWTLDRCGEIVAWDVRYAPADLGGFHISAALAAEGAGAEGGQAEGEQAPSAPTGSRRPRLPARPKPGTTFLVTTTNDSGPGSLAQAIADANATPNQEGPDAILFRIPGRGPHTITLSAALPSVTDPVEIDASTQPGARRGAGPEAAADAPPGAVPGPAPDAAADPPADAEPAPMVELDGSRLARPARGLVIVAGSSTIRGLRIHGFQGDAIRIEGGGSNVIQGNFLGGGAEDDRGDPNTGCGVAIVDSSDNAIGGSAAGVRNRIDGNGEHGVRITGAGSAGNSILDNSIVRNAEGGIDLDPGADGMHAGPGAGRGRGANNLQPAPALTSVAFVPSGAGRRAEVVVEGALDAEAGAPYRIEVYATGARTGAAAGVRTDTASRAEGERLLASIDVVTGEDGKTAFQLHLPRGVHSKDSITATATDREGNTSEFSEPAGVPVFTIRWNTGTGNWGTPANWDLLDVPSSTDDVLIADNNETNTIFTVTISAAAEANSLTLGGALGAQTLQVSSTLTLTSASSVGANGILALGTASAIGTITGSGDLTTDGVFDWLQGTMGGTGLTTLSGPTTLRGATFKRLADSRRMNNLGTAIWSGGELNVRNVSVLENRGTWDVRTDSPITGSSTSGSGTFTNFARLIKSAGTGATDVSIVFTNSGTVEAASGTLIFGLGGSSSNSFSISSPAATLQFRNQTFNLDPGSDVSGPGRMLVSGGTVNARSAISPAVLEVSGGTLNVDRLAAIHVSDRLRQSSGSITGTGDFTIDGAYDWSGGTLSGPGTGETPTTTVRGPLTVSGPVTVRSGRILDNRGAATWSAGNIGVGLGSVINNNGAWDVQTDATLGLFSSAPAAFNNLGVFRKLGGSGDQLVGINFTNAGEVELRSGTLSMNVNIAAYTQTAGITKLTGGSLFSASTRNINIRGGLLGGTGMVTGPVVVSGTGAVAPGLSAGALSLAGSYTHAQAAEGAGAFDLEIGGTETGQFDRLGVSGAAALGGALNVRLIDAFTPAAGSSFEFLTCGSRTGSYALVAPPVGCLGWSVSYGPTSAALSLAEGVAEVTGLRFQSDGQTLVWDRAASRPEPAYDVLRGALDQLPVDSGPDESCLTQTNTTDTTWSDPSVPAPGRGFWYLVRAQLAGCAGGTYGRNSRGAERMSAACP